MSQCFLERKYIAAVKQDAVKVDYLVPEDV